MRVGRWGVLSLFVVALLLVCGCKTSDLEDAGKVSAVQASGCDNPSEGVAGDATLILGTLRDEGHYQPASNVNCQLLVKISQAQVPANQAGVGVLHFKAEDQWKGSADQAKDKVPDAFTSNGRPRSPNPNQREEALTVAIVALSDAENSGKSLCQAVKDTFVPAMATVVPGCQPDPQPDQQNGAAPQDSQPGLVSPTLPGCTSPSAGVIRSASPASVSAPSAQSTSSASFSVNTNLMAPSGLTVEQITTFLKKKGASQDLINAASAFIEAEKSCGVNAQYLAAHACEESTCGNSQIARSKHNYFGYRAFDSSPGESAGTFSSATDSILFEAQFVKQKYLLPKGSSDTICQQKLRLELSGCGDFFGGATLAGMNKKYATDPAWSTKIAAIANELSRTSASSLDKKT